MKLTAILALFSLLAPLAAAEDVDCCHSFYVASRNSYHCEDNSLADPCCSYGGCDARCCNCDGTCRKLHVDLPKAHDRDDPMEILEELLDQSWLARLRGYDRNGDGAATLDEVREKNFRDPRIPDGDSHIVWFRKWDKDKNGVVNRQEGPKRQEE